MIDFSTLQGLTIPEGAVTQIADASGRVLWMLNTGSDKVILEVEKITSDTYAGETTYTAEEFILLDIYPKTNGTVSVTYGGLTKTITDTSGAAEPNAQQVFFGTFNGVSDEVSTPVSGTLTIEGDYASFAHGDYIAYSDNKSTPATCSCITNIVSLGKITKIYGMALGGAQDQTVKLVVPKTVISIGMLAAASMGALETLVIEGCPSIEYMAIVGSYLKTVKMLSTTPPELISSGGMYYPFGDPTGTEFALECISVPQGCVETYKTAEGWNCYEGYVDIVEAS